VPLGADPDSGLHEFWMPRSGAEPIRGADGRLGLAAETTVAMAEFDHSPRAPSLPSWSEGGLHFLPVRPANVAVDGVMLRWEAGDRGHAGYRVVRGAA